MQARDAAPLNLNQDATGARLPEPLPIRYPCGEALAVGDRMQFGQLKRREFITGLGGGLRATLKFLQRAELSRALPCASSLTVY